MSAAATAAGYLYASGRLRGRTKEGEEHDKVQVKRKPLRVAALPAADEPAPARAKTVRVEYRTRRWKPDAAQ